MAGREINTLLEHSDMVLHSFTPGLPNLSKHENTCDNL